MISDIENNTIFLQLIKSSNFAIRYNFDNIICPPKQKDVPL